MSYHCCCRIINVSLEVYLLIMFLFFLDHFFFFGRIFLFSVQQQSLRILDLNQKNETKGRLFVFQLTCESIFISCMFESPAKSHDSSTRRIIIRSDCLAFASQLNSSTLIPSTNLFAFHGKEQLAL